MTEPTVHGAYTARELERQYDNRGAVPEHVDIMAGWRRRSDAYAARPEVTLDLAYGAGPSEALDLFPCGTPGAPLLVYVHGGYWQRGDRGGYGFVAEGPNARGLDVAVVGYPLCPHVAMDAIVDAARHACAWLWREGPRLGFDRSRMHVAGHSAGGHLAAMLAATDWPGFAPDLPDRVVAGITGISGLYDLAPLVHTSINEALGLDHESATRLSPVEMPPREQVSVRLAVGSEESDEYHRQVDALVRAWRGPRVRVRTTEVADANHFTIVPALASPDGALLQAMLDDLAP